MLSVASRMRASADFDETVRGGRRAGRPTLTVHLLPAAGAPGERAGAPARAGLVVNKAVGGSVVRHRVARRFRHLLRERIGALAPGTRLVVRAAPSAGTAPWELLESDLDAALRAALDARDSSRLLPSSQSPPARSTRR